MLKTDNFDKNLHSMGGLAYAELVKELKKLKKLDYEYEFDRMDTLNTNIIDKKSGKKMYEKPFDELSKALEPFKKEYQRYPCVFFYGIGNGILYKTLLQNQNHKRLVIFEKSVELIYMALNLIDFSKELTQGRFIIVWTKDWTTSKATRLLSLDGLSMFFRLYTLHIHSNYYEKDLDTIKKINDINLNTMRSMTLHRGNDPKDALMGMEYYMINLPKMLTHPSLSELVKKRKKKTKYAILVATGPSLIKQLPLLKKYEKKATIFCADSAYTILHNHGVKPDYVLSLERHYETSKLFNYYFEEEYDKDIVFVVYGLTYPDTIKYLEKNNRTYVITQRFLSFGRYLGFKKCGFIGGGMSVSNMAYEFANFLLGYKHLILIGQDLAYSNEGKSHPEEYMYAINEEVDLNKANNLPKLKAYGGKGEVYSQTTWVLFKEFFEKYILDNHKHTKTYNCTEGGARIEGAIEKPFKQMCEQFLAKEPDKKPFAKLKKPPRKESNEDMLRAYGLIKKGQRLTARFIKECKKVQKQLDSLIHGKQQYTLIQINESIDKLKKRIEHPKSLFCNEILGPSFNQQEAALAPLYSQGFENESERQNKLLMWLYSHEAWVEELIDLLEVLEESVKIHIVPLREELERRKLL